MMGRGRTHEMTGCHRGSGTEVRVIEKLLTMVGKLGGLHVMLE